MKHRFPLPAPFFFLVQVENGGSVAAHFSGPASHGKRCAVSDRAKVQRQIPLLFCSSFRKF
jgi:hypothetical protein